MRNRVVDVVFTILLIALTAFAVYIYYANERLNAIIAKQNTLIKKTTGKDSAFIDEANDLKDSIKTYTEKITYIMGDKEISSSQFIELYNRLESKNDSLENELWELREKFKFAESRYKFKVVAERKGTTFNLDTRVSTADSARVALMFIGDRLKTNNKNKWYLEPDPQLKEIGKKAKDILESAAKDSVKDK